MDNTMTEPHAIRIDSRDLRDLIDERERLAASLADCARSAMTSADEWRDELKKADATITAFRVFEREVQEALGYDQPDLVPCEHLVAEIRHLVEQKLAASAGPWKHALTVPGTPQPATGNTTSEPPFTHTVTGPASEPGLTFSRQHITDTRLYGVGPALNTLAPGWSHDQDTPAGADQPAETSGTEPEVNVYARAAHALNNFVGWTIDQDSPPAAPRPRTWKTGDPEPATTGSTAVWGVQTEIGDLYRPKADEEHGWVWTTSNDVFWRWDTMLTAGPVTEVFPPSPEPHADTAAAVDQPAVDEQPAEQ
jgi:hypothetical protein